MNQLDHNLQEYRLGNLSWDRFVYHAVRYSDRLLRERHRLNREDRCELISDFYPRLQPLVENYRDRGASFDAYLASTLFHYHRAFIRRKNRRCRIESGIITADGCTDRNFTPRELVVEEASEPVYGTYTDEFRQIQGPGQPDTLRRQLLFAFCKNIPLLDAGELARYAALLDLPVLWVHAMVEFALRRNAERLLRRTILRERRDIHFAAMITMERRIKESMVNIEQTRLLSKYRYHRRLWLAYIHRLRVQNVHLSHRDLAALFGISKGSVDSAVYVLTQRLANAASNG
jgi:DNA-directed RNA polymerase specialized sigma24 family protein